MRRITLAILALVLFIPDLLAHPGRLDANGGHTDRSTGLYHCHREPCFSISGDTVGPAGEAAPFVTLYDRNGWPHWRDFDGDCQNTRDEVLIRDSAVPVTFADGTSCDVQLGLWLDPYTGKHYQDASEVSIDHLVPLRWAHGHGGDRWTTRQKEAFANDLENLVVVETRLNSAKGAKGPDDWLPPAEEYHCAYLNRFIEIIQKYRLLLLAVESEEISQNFQACSK